MSRLGDIAVRIEGPARSAGLGGGVAALLSELADRLDRLALTGDASSIDLRSLPLSPEDLQLLQETLGEGEVQAQLQAGGASAIRETAVAGLWWTLHRDPRGELSAELLDIARVPPILERAADEIQAAARELRIRIAAGIS